SVEPEGEKDELPIEKKEERMNLMLDDEQRRSRLSHSCLSNRACQYLLSSKWLLSSAH
ncbi:hypothetical protein GOODEAATRI_006696, partial [Goodea atripinnis]